MPQLTLGVFLVMVAIQMQDIETTGNLADGLLGDPGIEHQALIRPATQALPKSLIKDHAEPRDHRSILQRGAVEIPQGPGSLQVDKEGIFIKERLHAIGQLTVYPVGHSTHQPPIRLQDLAFHDLLHPLRETRRL